MPSLLNLGGVWVCRSTSSLISARASRRRLLVRISLGLWASRRAFQAEETSNFAVRRAVKESYLRF